MRRRTSGLVLAAMVASTLPTMTATAAAQPAAGDVFISEFHYDNAGTDAGEFVEVTAPAGTDLEDWSVVLYNGSGGGSYGTRALTGSVADQDGGYGTLVLDYPSNGIQNGGAEPDGIALVEDGTLVEFLSYEGTFTATDGPAQGVESTDVGVEQAGTEPEGASIERVGEVPDTWEWVSNDTDSKGQINDDLTFGGGTGDAPIVTECPSSLTVAQGEANEAPVSASDEDDRVVDAAITSEEVEGITLDDVTPAAEPGGMLTGELNVDATDLDLGTYPTTITFTNDQEPEARTATCTVDVEVVFEGDVCAVDDDQLTVVNDIQGSGTTTPLNGERVITRGVITTAFASGGETGVPNSHGLRGFFIEAVDEDRDEDPQTSEGLFVFDFDGLYDAEIGDLVHVYGTAGESFDVTQVSSNHFDVCDDAEVDTTLPAPAELPLPTAPEDRSEVMEPLESMRVTHAELTLVEFFQLERFGEVRLSSGGVFDNPTNVVSPHDDDAYNAIVEHNAANNIVLASGRTAQNIDRPGPDGTPPLPFLEPGDTLRIGDQLVDQTFVLHFAFGNWRLQPIDIDELSEDFQQNRTRPRPLTPPDVGGSLLVASYNVLNYFDGDGQGGGFPNARGAVTPSELERQTEKLVAAITKLDADIVGLIEIENDGGEGDGDEEFQATATLVDALNEEYGEDVYDFVDTGVIGTDAIKQAFIYKPATVEPTGDWAILDSSVDPRWEDQRHRPALAQTFTELATDEAINVTVNHLKSKGSECDAEDNDPRQGNCNGNRVRAAEALAEWMNDDPTGQDVAGSLIIGDINAYAEEDPITEILERGYTDLLKLFAPEDGPVPYSYTFDATQGRLDHALANDPLVPFVTGADEWHINADETQAIDYQESCCGISGNLRFRTEAVAEQYYQPNEFRSSDHDPVIVGLDLGDDPVCGPLGRYDRDRFTDTRGSAHERNLLCMADRGLTEGLRGGDRYGPRLEVNRGQMASFIARFIEHATGEELEEGDGFRDVPRSYAHAENINKLQNIGVTAGTARSNGEEFEPLMDVSRAQMASFISRALTYIEDGRGRPETVPPRTRTDHFPDDDGSTHEENINALAEADIVKGFNDGTYRWSQSVKRDQMASFVIRAYEYAVTEGSTQVDDDRR